MENESGEARSFSEPSAGSKPKSLASAELRRLDWAKDLSEGTLAAFEKSTEIIAYEAGDLVVDFEAEVTHVYFVVTGRLKAQLFDQLGKPIQEGSFGRGAVMGLFAIAMPERSHMRVVAAEPATVFRLTLAKLLELNSQHADFQLAVLRLGANLVKHVVMVDRALRKPAVVGVVHQSPASRVLTQKLAHRLHKLDELPCVVGDDPQWNPGGDIPFRSLLENGQILDEAAKQSLLREWSSRGRLLIDIQSQHPPERLISMLNYAEIVLWCVRPQEAEQALEYLRQLQHRVPWVREKIHLVWLLDSHTTVAPYVPELTGFSQRDFKLSFESLGPHYGPLIGNGFERLVHFLRGVQIGLALGGGAARGMAHLGVLKTLEEHGIYVDRIAGTSAGAMTGTVYATGLSPAYATYCFKTDLQPSWLFRQLPGGGYWYLLYKYRWNQFDRMLRKYLYQYRMEQLPIPMTTIAVDLVEGVPRTRDTGDAATNILESINLPPLSLPIYASGQALVDGGLLNNVPANVLVSRGCNFVIASTVTAKLEKDFMGIRSQSPTKKKRFFSTIQVIMRQTMIQNYNMNSVGVQPADFVIAPDVTSFDISEFTRADEMAAIGESTTQAAIGELRQLLTRLDPKLFAV